MIVTSHTQIELPVLQIEDSFDNRLRTLLSKIDGQANDQVKADLTSWKVQYQSINKHNIKAAHALLFLRTNTIAHIISECNDPQAELEWLSIYEELTTLACALLPRHVPPESFVKEHEEAMRGLQKRYQLTRLISEIEKMTAYLPNWETYQRYELIKSKLHDFNEEQKEGLEEVYTAVDRCMELVASLYDTIEEKLHALEQISLPEQLNNETVLDECLNILEHI